MLVMMARRTLFALVLAFCLSTVLAGRGNSANHPFDGTCNTEPDGPPGPQSPVAAGLRISKTAGGVRPGLRFAGGSSPPDEPPVGKVGAGIRFSFRSAPPEEPTTVDRAAGIAESFERAPVSTLVSVKRRNEPLQKRGGTVDYAPSCNNPIPARSTYNGVDGFHNMRDVLHQAHIDATDLAAAGNGITEDHSAFTHYFGGEEPGLQLTHFRQMMFLIAQSGSPYNIIFQCEDTRNVCTPLSLMATDPSPSKGPKNIVVCPTFWTAAATKYLLYNPERTSPSPPFRDNTKDQWCSTRAKGVSYNGPNFYATAGHTVLHELTHLDSLGVAVGLSKDQNNQHGTIDAQTVKEDGCELDGARAYLERYKRDTDIASPDYNAESYAAAATEIYWINTCKFSSIR